MGDKNVLVIMGSVRAGRICPKVAAWVAEIGRVSTDLKYEIVDLAAWPLPMDDEPALPALAAVYAQAHTRAWSDKIKHADGLVFVTPQFNWGYPAALKNAIDHLYHEWRDKPVAIVTYGGHGGTRCAKQLRQVAASVKMRVVTTTPAIELPDAIIRHGAPFEPRDFSAYQPRIQRALTALAAQIHGAESALTRLNRKRKALFAALT